MYGRRRGNPAAVCKLTPTGENAARIIAHHSKPQNLSNLPVAGSVLDIAPRTALASKRNEKMTVAQTNRGPATVFAVRQTRKNTTHAIQRNSLLVVAAIAVLQRLWRVLASGFRAHE
jgi:hypothetical protein